MFHFSDSLLIVSLFLFFVALIGGIETLGAVARCEWVKTHTSKNASWDCSHAETLCPDVHTGSLLNVLDFSLIMVVIQARYIAGYFGHQVSSQISYVVVSQRGKSAS